MTPENQKREQRITSMRDEVADLFLDTQLNDLKEEIIVEQGGHPYNPEQASTHERQLLPHEQIYQAGLHLSARRSEISGVSQPEYVKAA